MPRTSKYENSNQALKLLCEIIDDAITHPSRKPRDLQLAYTEARGDKEAQSAITLNSGELTRMPARLFPELLRTARLMAATSAWSKKYLLGSFTFNRADGFNPDVHYCQIAFAEKSPDELLDDLQTLYRRIQDSAAVDQKTDEDKFEFGSHPYTKLAFMAINIAISSKVRHMSFVNIREYVCDKEFRLHILVDNFMVPPPAHMWPGISAILSVMAKGAQEGNLVGEFAYHQNYQREGDNLTPIANYWDIYFSPNPRRNLGSELITLFQTSERAIYDKLEKPLADEAANNK
ncbi:MAG: hypothetical protein HYZ62_00435 [Candidatus Andersenbacteria bacterium]|nr:hypothetical protein [Candidatus Andersenbacteria bacterium]